MPRLPPGDTLPMEDARPPIALTMRPMPAIATPALSPTMPSTLIERYVQQLSELNGVVSCCVFDVQSGTPDRPRRRQPGLGRLADARQRR